jgi:hypothetical protein
MNENWKIRLIILFLFIAVIYLDVMMWKNQNKIGQCLTVCDDNKIVDCALTRVICRH